MANNVVTRWSGVRLGLLGRGLLGIAVLSISLASVAGAGDPVPVPRPKPAVKAAVKPAPAPAPASASAAGDGFSSFCDQWMEKLARRERDNVKNVAFNKRDGDVVGEYTGYERAPLRCESRVKKAGTPGVGVLVYRELRYRKQGRDGVKARSSEPQVVDRTEVTEIFRYDGARWSY